MTAEIAFQANDSEDNPILSKLTLTAAGLTIFLAILSLIVSNRLETLGVRYQEMIHKSSTTEAGIQNELKSVTAELSATKQSLKTEKAATDKLKKKIAVITQESEKIKADLALAQKTIIELRSAETMESLPSSNSPLSDDSSNEIPSDLDVESKGLITTPEVQSSISSPPIQESTDGTSTEEAAAPSTSASKPPVPSENETAPEPIQAQ